MSTKPSLESPADLPLPRPLAGLSQIAGDYGTFFIDLWGVVHNGIAPFPGVVACLEALRADGKKVCLLTNAPQRPAAIIARLEEMGIPRSYYSVLVSSGEVTHHILTDRPEPFHRSLGRRCFHLGPKRHCDVHEGPDIDLVSAPEAASFVLNTGIEDYTETLEQHLPMLERAAAAGLPMLCANPDIVVVVGGIRAICAGTMAEAYEKMGGEVGYVGKPYRAVYDFALREMQHPPGEPVLCVGDGFHTDITGADRAGFDSVFVSGGIHADELDGGDPASPAIGGLIARFGVAPTYALRSLAW